MMLKLCNGKFFEVPMFDPVVAAHFNDPVNHTSLLLDEIFTKRIYARFFEGKSDLTFVDIGANAGLVSVYAAPACSKIVAVEPSPQVFDVLKALTYKFPQIEIVKAALAPTCGPVQFFVNDINSTASSTVNTHGQKIESAGLTLSSILSIYQLEKVDILKVDAEGAEGESLSFEELESAKPIVRTLFVECHNCPKSKWETKLGYLIRDLSRLGYYRQEVNGTALIASLP